MKKIFGIVVSILSICLVLTACGSGSKTGTGNKGDSSGKDFVVPKNLMTTEEYQNEFKALLSKENLSTADSDFMAKLDNLTNRLEEQIRYNTDDIKETSGNTYYLSNNGDDNNDGKSPKTAWKTLDKLNNSELGNGDLVLFERGSIFRGYVAAQSNVSYSAYGTGPKPIIAAANEASSVGKWVETETPNVWKLDKRLAQKDVGFILIKDKQGNEICGEKYVESSKISKNYDFVYTGPTLEEGKTDMSIYLYYDGGNPDDVFESIEIPMNTSIFVPFAGIQNVTINNLELLYGRGPFWPADSKNISITYCVMGWSGGFADSKGGVRYNGGGGAWHGCDGFTWDHCYIYQQYDSGVSPQFIGSSDENPSIFKDFITKNCLFKGCEWTLEYYTQQPNSLENRFENLYFGYNICREGGAGFGTKASTSAYVKSWGHENTCYNSKIEYNVFDRAAALTIEVIGYEQSASGNTLSYERIPKLNNNIYIQKKNKNFANINTKRYKFTENSLKDYMSGGFDTDSLYLFSE